MSEEIVEIVDEHNNVLEPLPRCIMRQNRLIHRATYCLLKTPSNYYYVQKRSALKDYCPNYFDPTPGGVVAAGESYEYTNQREIEEEMGVANAPCTHIKTFYYEDARLFYKQYLFPVVKMCRIRCWGDIWECEYEGPIKMQKEEVSDVLLLSMEEIMSRYKNGEDFTPDSMAACEHYVAIRGLLEPLADRPVVQLIE